MMNVQILCVGKLKEQYLRDACAEYSKRLGAFCKLSVVEINECKISNNPNQAEIERVIETEGVSILNKIPAQSYVIPMCIEGKQMSSEQLSQKFEQVALNGISSVTFIIGGSYGLSNQIKQRADYRLSMSCMTFPHQLARVMLLEQIYRAFSISANTKYHK